MRPERPDTLDALDVSDATSLTRTPLTMAPCVRTQLSGRLRSDATATAYAFRRRSVRAFFLLDAECEGKCPPDDACHGICLLDEECQDIFPSGPSACLTDAECHGNFLPD